MGNSLPLEERPSVEEEENDNSYLAKEEPFLEPSQISRQIFQAIRRTTIEKIMEMNETQKDRLSKIKDDQNRNWKTWKPLQNILTQSIEKMLNECLELCEKDTDFTINQEKEENEENEEKKTSTSSQPKNTPKYPKYPQGALKPYISSLSLQKYEDLLLETTPLSRPSLKVSKKDFLQRPCKICLILDEIYCMADASTKKAKNRMAIAGQNSFVAIVEVGTEESGKVLKEKKFPGRFGENHFLGLKSFQQEYLTVCSVEHLLILDISTLDELAKFSGVRAQFDCKLN